MITVYYMDRAYLRRVKGMEIKTLNTLSFPKRYFPFSSEDSSHFPEIPLTAQVRLSGCFSENIVDLVYSKELELGEIFSVRTPAPLLRWHPAKQGTTSEFQGHLSKIFPELEKIDDKDLDELIGEMRNRGE